MFLEPDRESIRSSPLDGSQGDEFQQSGTVQADRPFDNCLQPRADWRPLVKRRLDQNPVAAEIDGFAAAFNRVGSGKRAESDLQLNRFARFGPALDFLFHGAILGNR